LSGEVPGGSLLANRAGAEATPAEGSPHLDVVVVSYRCRELLESCLESLHSKGMNGWMTLRVVDNASADGTAEMVARSFPEVDLVAAKRNLGFAAANNLALARGDSEYVLILNPDTRVDPRVLPTLVSLMERYREIGVCGPALVRPDGRPDHAASRAFPTPMSALGWFSQMGRLRAAPSFLRGYAAPPSRGGPVDAVNGAFMLARRDALDQVGWFDEGYWMYMEDLDLCYRLAQSGWFTWYEPSVTAMHVKGGSAGAVRNPRLTYHFHRGMYRFYRTHYAADRAWPVNLAVYVGIALKLAASLAASLARRIRRS
jgi:GT2 family glycosyltransferase